MRLVRALEITLSVPVDRVVAQSVDQLLARTDGSIELECALERAWRVVAVVAAFVENAETVLGERLQIQESFTLLDREGLQEQLLRKLVVAALLLEDAEHVQRVGFTLEVTESSSQVERLAEAPLCRLEIALLARHVTEPRHGRRLTLPIGGLSTQLERLRGQLASALGITALEGDRREDSQRLELQRWIDDLSSPLQNGGCQVLGALELGELEVGVREVRSRQLEIRREIESHLEVVQSVPGAVGARLVDAGRKQPIDERIGRVAIVEVRKTRPRGAAA